MLNDALKKEIQAAYSELLEQKGYRARHCQKSMIATIARTLGDIPEAEAICVVEAGTGTGKTLGYAMAAIPIAKKLKKKVVIATATIALQEQIVYHDLPDIRLHSGLEFTYALAKGRRRYLCLSRLDQAMQGGGGANPSLSLFTDASDGSSQDDDQIFQDMLSSLGQGNWDGERDSWPKELEHSTWSRISTDHTQCTQRQCSHYENCYFYRARENVHRVDCIVTNQDLVLSDLMMGGGAVLPDPEDTIYIFDECHHLPDKAGNHFSHVFAVYGTKGWLAQIPASMSLAMATIAAIQPHVATQIEPLAVRAGELLDDAAAILMPFRQEADEEGEGWRYRFPEGAVTEEVTIIATHLAEVFERLSSPVEQVHMTIQDSLEDTPAAERHEVEHWLSVFGSLITRVTAAAALWRNYSELKLNPPYARWISFAALGQMEGMEIQLSSHPVSVADELQRRLWSQCAGAVLTSATISVGGDFSDFQKRTGIDSERVFVSLPSPFNYPQQATLHVPKMRSEPGDFEAHSGEIATILPELLGSEPGALVLFTSWRQMLKVYDILPVDFRKRVLMQGDQSKAEMLSMHRDAVDEGRQSCLFGLASFSEGVDLPGDYCRHVVIAKLPFAVPDDPVGATLSEWVEARGGNSFYEVMLPGAVLKVIQAAGRLLRTETDEGRVTILDRRVVTKAYGRVILDALPPFRREIY